MTTELTLGLPSMHGRLLLESYSRSTAVCGIQCTCKVPNPDLKTPRNESIYRETLLFVIHRGMVLEVGNVLPSGLGCLCHLGQGTRLVRTCRIFCML